MGMEQVRWDYSTKNIPIPDKRDYLQCLIQKTKNFLRSANWKAHFFLNPQAKSNQQKTYGFPSSKPPPRVQEMKDFEENMLDLLQDVKFNQPNNQHDSFLRNLGKDCNHIKNESKLFVPADKTTNYYKLEASQYDKLLKENIQKEYKKTNKVQEKRLIKSDVSIASELGLGDRIDVPAKTEGFITLKDHKNNFQNNPSCRLINPNKSEIGKISKKILHNINSTIKAKTKLNQWISTKEVLNWFKNIENKEKSSFIQFDVCEFYPSISDSLLSKALDFA